MKYIPKDLYRIILAFSECSKRIYTTDLFIVMLLISTYISTALILRYVAWDPRITEGKLLGDFEKTLKTQCVFNEKQCAVA